MKSLADVVSGAGLSRYAEVALLLFFLVFVVVLLRVLTVRPDVMKRAAELPFTDEPRRGAD